MKNILVMFVCLWGAVSLAVIPGSVLALSGAYLGLFGLVQKAALEDIEPLTPADSAKVKSKLQSLYNRGLLRCKPGSINLSYGPDFAALSLTNPILYVEKGVEFDEFTALHEAEHINGMHTLVRGLISYAALCIAFSKGWSPSFIRNALRVAGVKVAIDSTAFFQRKYSEWSADNHAAKNCSDVTAFKNAIKTFRLVELEAKEYFKYRYKTKDRSILKALLYLNDTHVPLTESRADRLQRIYNRRVAEGSLVE